MPKANEAQLEQDDAVDVSRVDGKLGVSRLSTSGVTLEHLLAGLTEQNLHGSAAPGDKSPGSMTAPHKWG